MCSTYMTFIIYSNNFKISGSKYIDVFKKLGVTNFSPLILVSNKVKNVGERIGEPF